MAEQQKAQAHARSARVSASHEARAAHARETRRRGEALEDALIAAAAEELAEVGYQRLSFKGVAARAGTSRSVLNRRWSSRIEMVLSVLRAKGSIFADEPADTGSLRGDMLALLRDYVRRSEEISPDVMIGIIGDGLAGDGASSFDLQKNMGRADLAHTRIIVQRAAQRGQARTGAADHVLAVPIELLRARLLISGEPASQTYLEQIVDDIFLPLVQQ
ncbi:MAG: TetR/AcrR family transcriptional regulator C-terminal ligand-binding domain-containing protein [Coriobacteriia bacterium]|nr:TetR/AcrR family transcriptional regulator C-terminal ligand-binding domain-containing protein [Coriobacteriia bacterium]